MNPEMTRIGRQLEGQVAGMMQLLDSIQSDLAGVSSPAAVAALGELAGRRAALAETIRTLQQGQAELERRMEQHAAALASREAAIEAGHVELAALTRRLVNVQEDERRALAGDLHDTASGALTGLGLGLAWLKREGGLGEKMRGRIEDLQRMTSGLAEDLHRLSANLRPTTLDRYGLVPACEDLVIALRGQADIPVDFHAEGLDERLPQEVETALYRIVQEACTNIARHADASWASVSLAREGDRVQVRVEDDGRGFDPAETLARGGMGLTGMRERAEMLGGSFAIDSGPGRGTSLLAEVPNTCCEDAGPAGRSPGASGRGPGASGRGPDGNIPVGPVDSPVSSEVAELSRVLALNDALVTMNGAALRLADVQQAPAFILERAAATVGADYAVITRRIRRRWVISHASGLPDAMVGRRLLPAAVRLAREIERTQAAVVVNDTERDDPLAAAAREAGVFSGVGFPLVARGRFLGVVAFVHYVAPVAFKPSEVEFLRHVSTVLSLVLAIDHLREKGPA